MLNVGLNHCFSREEKNERTGRRNDGSSDGHFLPLPIFLSSSESWQRENGRERMNGKERERERNRQEKQRKEKMKVIKKITF